VTVLLPRDLGWTFESLNFSVHLNISSGLGYFVKKQVKVIHTTSKQIGLKCLLTRY
jgi:hypothetical protein